VTIGNLTIPVLNRFDVLAECIASIDCQIDRLMIINNSADPSKEAMISEMIASQPMVTAHRVITPIVNMGVAASWNFAIRQFRDDDVIMIANADTTFAGGDLIELWNTADHDQPRWVGVNGDWRIMALNRACVDVVGMFDENYHPIYCEDVDYERRCTLNNVPWIFIPGMSSHIGSVSWKSDPTLGRANQRTYAENVRYHIAKWGAPPRSGEHFTTPFGQGFPLDYWRVAIDRIDDLDWHRDGDIQHG